MAYIARVAIQTNYSADIGDLDRSLTEAQAERPEKPLRIRIQPQVFRTRPNGGGHYRAWAEVSWIVECPTVDDARELRETLRTVFHAINVHGVAHVQARLGEKELTTGSTVE